MCFYKLVGDDEVLEECIVRLLKNSRFNTRSELTQLLIFKKGRPTPNLPNMTSKNKTCTRKFHNFYYEKLPWLTACAELNKLFCWPCLLFSDVQTRWISKGYSDLNNFNITWKKHQKDQAHKDSVLHFENYKSLNNIIDPDPVTFVAPSAVIRKKKNRKLSNKMNIKTKKEIDPLQVPKSIKRKANKEPGYGSIKQIRTSNLPEPVNIKFEPREEGELKFKEEAAILGTSVVRVEFKQEIEENEMRFAEFETVKIESEPAEFCLVDNNPELGEFENVEMRFEDFDDEPILDEYSKNDIKDDPLSYHENSSNKKEEEYIFENKTVSCNICFKIIKGSTALIEHKKRLHPRQKTNNCDYCNKYFKSKELLYLHIIRLHSDRKFACNQCDYVGKCKQYLLFHIRYQHNLNKTYNCDFCDKYFKNSKLLDGHIKTVHSDGKFECSQCEYVGKCKAYLRSHIKSNH